MPTVQHFRHWRGPAFRGLIVLTGVCAAILTVYARRAGDLELARVGAVGSLVCAVLMVVFVVPPLLRSARVEAAQLNLPFQLTGGGFVFLGVFGVVSFSAWSTGNNLLFLIFSVMASVLFVGWAAARAGLRDLAVSARFPDHIFAGDAAPVIVTLHNTKRVLPSFSVLVEARSRLDEGGAGRRRFALRRARFEKRPLAYFTYAPRRARVEQRVEQTFPRRGHVLITGFEISTRFPFGFFRLRRRLRARDVDLIIYPKPEAAGDELHLLPMEAGQMTTARRGAGHDLHSLREYQPQDDVRHIDWKATARLSRLVVREFTAEDERRVHVALDTSVGVPQAIGDVGKKDAGGGEKGEAGRDFGARFERGVTLAASLVAHFIDERAEVRLTLGDEGGRYGAGREHLYDCLRRLALVAPAPPRAAAPDHHLEFLQRLAPPPSASADNYVILLTTAPPGSIPADLWRKSHVIYL